MHNFIQDWMKFFFNVNKYEFRTTKMIPGYTNIGPDQYSFTTGNEVVDDIFGVEYFIYSDNTKSDVLISNGRYKMYWNAINKTITINYFCILISIVVIFNLNSLLKF